MIGDIWNWCTSCGRSIPAHQPFRTWCDICVDELRDRLKQNAIRVDNERANRIKQDPDKP